MYLWTWYGNFYLIYTIITVSSCLIFWLNAQFCWESSCGWGLFVITVVVSCDRLVGNKQLQCVNHCRTVSLKWNGAPSSEQGGGGTQRQQKECQRVHISLWHTSADNVVACPYTVIHISYTSNSPFQKISVYEKQNSLYVFGGRLIDNSRKIVVPHWWTIFSKLIRSRASTQVLHLHIVLRLNKVLPYYLFI